MVASDACLGVVPVEAHVGGWRAALGLQVRRLGARTVVDRLRQFGPLVVQRPFHEPDGTAHVYLLHPPGGVVGGDELSLEVEALPGSRSLFTTPGAAKIYRSAGPLSLLNVNARVRGDAHLEWMPHETIVFAGARARSSLRFELDPQAQLFSWEVLCWGRGEKSEPLRDSWSSGSWTQETTLERSGQVLWRERFRVQGGAPILSEPWGFGGQPVLGTLIATGASPAWLGPLREVAKAGTQSISVMGEVLVARYLGPRSDQAKEFFESVWSVVRPLLSGRIPKRPRIWAT
jgi:urease accessory protein